MTPVHVVLLGGFLVSATALPVKARALLAYLAVRPGTFHLRDKLATLLWGDVDDARARDSLRQAIGSLRRTLRPSDAPVVIERDQAFAVEPSLVDVDVVRFERLAAGHTPEEWRAAAECYAGDFLEGWTVGGAEFEEWLTSERERLREIAIEALARLLAFQSRPAASPADVDEAVSTARRLLGLDPLQEAVHRALMRLHARQGRRGAALRQYQLSVAVLRRELNAEPEADTRRLYEEILVQPPATSLPPSSDAGVTSGPLYGREAELRTIRRVLGDLDRGRGRMVLVLGEAGIGKTALLDALRTDIASSDRPLFVQGRSHQTTQVMPFGPWVDAFRAAGIPQAIAGLTSLEQRWRVELTRLFPELAGHDLPSEATMLPLLESVWQLLEQLSGTRTIALTLEDIHWADDSSLRLLAFVARKIAGAPILLAVTARTDDLTRLPLLQALVEEMEREPHAQVLRPEPLSREDVARLTASRLRTGTAGAELDQSAGWVWTLSRGNPHLAVEILKSFEAAPAAERSAALSTGVRHLIERRLDGLREPAQRLAATASIVQREFDFRFIARAAGMPAHDASEAIEELVRRGVLQAMGETFDFVHHRVRELVYERISDQRRRILHGVVGRAIEDAPDDELDRHVAEAGCHFELAGEQMKAAAYFTRAANQAVKQSAYAEAVGFAERAIAAVEREPESPETIRQVIDLRLDLRSMFIPLGDFEGVLRSLQQAEALATTSGDQARLGRISCHMTQFFWVGAQYGAARASGERALALAEQLGDVGMRAEAAFFLGTTGCGTGDYDYAAAALESNAERLTGPLNTERFGLPFIPSAASRVFLAWALAEQGAFDKASARAAEIATIADATGDRFGTIEAHFATGFVQVRRGEFGVAAESLAKGVAICRAARIPLLFPFGASHLGLALAYSGRPQEGIALLEEALAQAATMHLGANMSRWMSMLGEAHLAAGGVLRAEEYGARARDLAQQAGERGHEAWALWLLANVASARGHHAQALEYYRRCDTIAAELGMGALARLSRFGAAAVPITDRGSIESDAERRLATEALDALGMGGWHSALAASTRPRRDDA